MNNKITQEQFGYYIKFIFGVLFLAFIGGFISLAFLETIGYEDVSVRVLWGILAVVISLYCWNAEPKKYPQHTQTPWEARVQQVGDLCGLAFFTFFFAAFSLALLAAVLQWVLEIDISNMEYTYRLSMLAWGAWIIGVPLYNKYKYDKQQ